MMANKKLEEIVIKVVWFFCYVISAILTGILMYHLGKDLFESLLYIGLGVFCLEVAKAILPIFAFKFLDSGDKGRAAAVFITSFLLTVLSLSATIATQLSSNASLRDRATISSAGYSGLNTQLSSYDASIESLRRQAEGLPTNYVTARGELLGQINELTEKRSQTADRLSEYSRNYSGESLGANAFFNAISRAFGVKPDAVELGASTYIAILLELLSIILGMIIVLIDSDVEIVQAFRDANGNIFAMDSGGICGLSQNPVNGGPAAATAENRNPIGFNQPLRPSQNEPQEPSQADVWSNPTVTGQPGEPSQNGFKQPDMERFQDSVKCRPSQGSKPSQKPSQKINLKGYIFDYVNMLFQDRNGDRLNGRLKVAQSLGLDEQHGRQAHEFLKSNNLIRVKGNSTYPKVAQSKMIQRIQELV